jgi:hydrogenase maturation protease
MTVLADDGHDAPAPWLVLAVGNPSRGDDALGPELIERLLHLEAGSSDVEFLSDFQLQIEHALDISGRRAVLFVDAARPGVVLQAAFGDIADAHASQHTACGVSLVPINADERFPVASHALRAEAVLEVARRLKMRLPPAWQLAIEGQAFALGEGLSEAAERHLDQAVLMAQSWLSTRRSEKPDV